MSEAIELRAASPAADPRALYEAAPWRAHYGERARRGDRLRPYALFDMLLWAARHFGERPHLTFLDHTITYSESLELAERLAVGLAGLGVGKGDRVGFCMTNHPIYGVLHFALWRLGAVGVSMNPLYPVNRLADQAADAGVKVILTTDDPAQGDQYLVLGEVGPQRPAMVLVRHDEGDMHIAPRVSQAAAAAGALLLSDLLVSDGDLPAVTIAPEEDLAVLAYTGGTTGTPKGVMLTHANLSMNCQQMHSWYPQLTAGAESMCVGAPLTHIAGISPTLNFMTHIAGEIVIQPRFDPADLLKGVDGGCTSVLLLTPTMLVAMGDLMDRQPVDWTRLKLVQCGAAPLTPELKRRFETATGQQVINLFGMTETSPAVVYGLPNAPGGDVATGCPLPLTRVQVRAKDDPSKCVPLGEAGELCFAGPQVTRGYWKRDDENEASFVDGLLRTGDVGYVTEAGLVHVIDRLKDVIIAGGANVYPAQVESVLAEHPAIAEAAVIGSPDPYRGETVKAIVRLRPGQTLTLEQLRADLAGKLSPIEAPKILEVMDDLPRTPNMKVSRQALRERELAAAAAGKVSDRA
ncbi:AMP-binding protein [Tsuneonella troitsensis]|uniref:AMP-binding protein n=1 Tax=Tsuneonella troitsensis TaxID=292222 RepID=UPI00070B12BA|nr:AMP-binding protein [Tsuneonella troitsensis]